jgi:hypothetical protein
MSTTLLSSHTHNGGTGRIRTNVNSHMDSLIRRLSWADKTSDQYHGHKGKEEDGASAKDDSDSDSYATPRAVSPVDLSAVSDDDDDDDDADDTSSTHATKAVAEKTNSTNTASSNHSTKRKRMHTTKGVNTTESTTEDVTPASPSNTTTSTTTTSTIPSISQWDTLNVTYDPTNMTTNSTAMIPPEQTQPDSWPVIVFGIFCLLAVGLCSATAVKHCRNNKRQNYDEIESLIV